MHIDAYLQTKAESWSYLPGLGDRDPDMVSLIECRFFELKWVSQQKGRRIKHSYHERQIPTPSHLPAHNIPKHHHIKSNIRRANQKKSFKTQNKECMKRLE